MAQPLAKRPVLHLPLSRLEKIIEAAAGIGILVAIFILLFYRPILPDSVPSHFGAAGTPDAWGNKGLLSILIAIPAVLYLGMTLLSRFPQIYNYPFALTEENVESQYRCARMLMSALKAEITWFFVYLEWRVIQIAFGSGQGLGSNLKFILLVCFAVTLAVYFYCASRLR